MDWVPLTLDAVQAVTQQVDAAVQRFRALSEAAVADPSGALQAYLQMREALEQRVDQLENFYLDHDSDERALLFEKQRLKLRKQLRDDTTYAKVQSLMQQARSQSPAREEAQPHSQSRARAAAPAQDDAASIRSDTSASRRVRPIYDWETPGPSSSAAAAAAAAQPPPVSASAAAAAADRFVHPHGTPSSGNGQASQAQPPRSFEFQIKLTPEEFEALQQRRVNSGRGPFRQQRSFVSFLHKGEGRLSFRNVSTPAAVANSNSESAGQSPFITSQGPYVEPTLINSFRSTEKHKWVAPQDFQVAVGKADSKRLTNTPGTGEFLHSGLEYQSSNSNVYMMNKTRTFHAGTSTLSEKSASSDVWNRASQLDALQH